MRNWLPLCFAVAAVIAAPAQAQYIYFDSDGDGICTSTDIMFPEARIDVWIDTAHDHDGNPVTCETGQDLTISSYEVVISLSNVVALGWENARPEFTQSLGFEVEGSFARAGFTSGGGTYLVPGLYKLGTILTRWGSGCPLIGPAQSAFFSGQKHSTELQTQCLGLDGDYTLRLGEDFVDACGVIYVCDDATSTTWGKIKALYRGE